MARPLRTPRTSVPELIGRAPSGSARQSSQLRACDARQVLEVGHGLVPSRQLGTERDDINDFGNEKDRSIWPSPRQKSLVGDCARGVALARHAWTVMFSN